MTGEPCQTADAQPLRHRIRDSFLVWGTLPGKSPAGGLISALCRQPGGLQQHLQPLAALVTNGLIVLFRESAGAWSLTLHRAGAQHVCAVVTPAVCGAPWEPVCYLCIQLGIAHTIRWDN